NYSWGDVVKVENRNGELYVIALVTESGHSTVQIIFFDRSVIESTKAQLQEMGCEYEVSDLSFLISLDIPPKVDYKSVRIFLDDGAQKEFWSFREACLAHQI
ncbi:MAG: DUF4265 domain-containing protein, partial [Flavobacterium sp.]